MCQMIKQHFIQHALEIGAIEFIPGGRTLKSGRLSPYFFNSGLFTGDSFKFLIESYVKTIGSDTNHEVVFGPAYKGIPLCVAIAHVSRSFTFAFNRKEAKEHGDGGMVVGSSLKGKKVLIVDDVMTTGGSIYEALGIICAHGGDPVECVIAFDRQEKVVGGSFSAVQQFEMYYGIPVRSIVTLMDLIIFVQNFPKESGDTGGVVLSMLLEYKKEYGV